MDDLTLPLPGLSPVLDKDIIARFDGGSISSDGGLLVLREVQRRSGLPARLAACLDDPRDPGRIQHTLADMIAFRTLMIAAGYEDANDAGALRRDPVFKMALERLPGGADLCSQPTLSRLENLPDIRALIRMGRTMVEAYCASFRHVPKRIVLDIDDTFDAVHGGQQLRLFNAHHDDYGFQPIVVFDGDGRLVGAVLRPAKRPKGREIAGHLRRLIREIRAHWPRVEILLRGDRTSCSKATANQMRLVLHGAAYWLMWSLRSIMPKRSQWRRAQVDTLRLRLIKVAVRVVERKTRVVLSLPTGSPAEALMRLALDRLPTLAPG